MQKFIMFIIKSIFIIYVLVGILLYVFQRNLLYFPTTKINHTLKCMTLEHDDIRLNTIVLNEGKEDAIVYFGGNAESVFYNAEKFKKTFSTFTIYLVDYRGYGLSSGQPTEENLFKDALFVYDNIKKKHKKINIIGRSLGSGVASYLTSKREINKLALITPFDSLEYVAQQMYPFYPLGLILKDKYCSVKYLELKMSKNILILMAENDSLIHISHGYALAKSLPKKEVQVEVIANAGHNSISDFSRYYTILHQFMNTK